jgi:hypothetical protein
MNLLCKSPLICALRSFLEVYYTLVNKLTFKLIKRGHQSNSGLLELLPSACLGMSLFQSVGQQIKSAAGCCCRMLVRVKT